MKFEMPIAEVIALDVCDIITTSGTVEETTPFNPDFGSESEPEW